HHDAALHDLRDKLEAVFIRLGEANEVLRNPQTRAAYDRQLAAPAEAAPAAGDPQDLARRAEQAIRRAARSVAEEKYWDAIQLLETAVPRAEGAVKQAGRILLARAYCKNPKWLKQGEQLLQQVVQEDPGNAEAHFHLAGIYRGGGLRSRAATMLRRVLELQPGHEQAQAQLAELEAEAPPPPPDAGLLGKLLRRK
ncbi:MAG TPA: tetratricopeptide repeat protein, partial [Vicinamibacteria bacterium]|nr:tetratricopeptide repeat protein [Vicinamibacteria bacterium]